MTDAEGYRRRADEAECWARKCREKLKYKPQSRTTYEALHDQSIAEMFFNDALARAATRNPDNMVREMKEFEQDITTKYLSSTALDHQRFLDQLKRLVSHYLESENNSA